VSGALVVLLPESGRVDVVAVSAYLDSLPFAFPDPVAGPIAGFPAVGRVWLVSVSPAAAAFAGQLRLADPTRFPPGALVGVAPDRVWAYLEADREERAQAGRILGWVLQRGRYRAELDGRTASATIEALVPDHGKPVDEVPRE
jgi:hypothetical protein